MRRVLRQGAPCSHRRRACASAMEERVSPRWMSSRRRPGRRLRAGAGRCGLGGGRGRAAEGDGRAVAPALREQTGHAPQPCPASTRSATTICCSRLAWLALSAKTLPPKACHVEGGELEPTEEPVAGVDVPVAAALALGNPVPHGVGGGVGRGGGGEERASGDRAREGCAGNGLAGGAGSTVTTAVTSHDMTPGRCASASGRWGHPGRFPVRA